MPRCESIYFGMLDYEGDAVIDMPGGLFGFEAERRFVLIQRPDQAPLVFMQSLSLPDLCFVTLPVLAVDRQYALFLSNEETQAIGLSGPAEIGTTVLCLALVTADRTCPTANLRAPIVVNLASRTGAQFIGPPGRYSHQHSLLAAEAAK